MMIKGHGKIETSLKSCDIPMNKLSQITFSCMTKMLIK